MVVENGEGGRRSTAADSCCQVGQRLSNDLICCDAELGIELEQSGGTRFDAQQAVGRKDYTITAEVVAATAATAGLAGLSVVVLMAVALWDDLSCASLIAFSAFCRATASACWSSRAWALCAWVSDLGISGA